MDEQMELTVYLAPFHFSHTGYGDGGCRSSYKPLSDALERGDWPYDIGDDPSFFSLRYFGGNLTWGICRQQVRNPIRPGDIVVFFSSQQERHSKAIEYCLCAVATVERKVWQADIFNDPGLRLYRRYLNLLIRKRGEGWEHFEGGSPRAMWHKDWAWRIVDHDGWRKKAFEKLNASEFLLKAARIKGHPIEIAANYVIFSNRPTETSILDKPPLVALCRRSGRHEEWKTDSPSQKIKRLTVDFSKNHGGRATLRTCNLQQAHPCDRWKMSLEEATEWRNRLIHVLQNA
jgi:hypothetical protein